MQNLVPEVEKWVERGERGGVRERERGGVRERGSERVLTVPQFDKVIQGRKRRTTVNQFD